MMNEIKNFQVSMTFIKIEMSLGLIIFTHSKSYNCQFVENLILMLMNELNCE